MKEYEVWCEGYRATGESSPANFYGKVEANSFIEACEKLIPGLDKNDDGSLRMYKAGHPQVWACSCYDNEADARKSFG